MINDFEMWAEKGHWTNWERKPERIALLMRLISRHVATLAEGQVISTTALIQAILPGLSGRGSAYVSGGLQYLRNNGLMPGHWKNGPKNGRTFGRPSIKWFNPVYNDTGGLEKIL